ncbi:MAG TPA: cellulose synthase complex periplasmic endoglucanase BcsZ, partial [Myxococcales bacterium]|nr:cellulose synthase complex periplasmic endoglucanase BcsZ [Myxococcales bacterium]
MIALLAGALLATSPCDASWPLFSRYAEAFVAGDGRVIDRNANDRSTSEGQAYALFFSLVANDRALFDRLLTWTEQNLAQNDLRKNLPAWHWGKRKDGSWGVIDPNSASDADLWLAYDLLEAGRLWSDPRYTGLGKRILANAAAREVAEVPGFGPALLPGPVGFRIDGGFRVNPSYAPPQLLRRFAALGEPWEKVRESSMRFLQLFAEGGAVPDWALAKGGHLVADPV